MIPIGKVCTLVVLLMLTPTPGGGEENGLTEAEKKAGWRLLFDGKTTEGWRGYKMDKMPPGWKVIDELAVGTQRIGPLPARKGPAGEARRRQ